MAANLSEVTGVVLAGGEGRKFKPYTDIIPKPMVPVGPDEKPLLEHIIKWFVKHGVKNIVLLVGYRWKQVVNYFLDGSRWGAKLSFSLDTEEYKGTGGALLNAYLRKMFSGEKLIIWYGDILAPLDITSLLATHESSNADATLVLADKYQVPVGIAEVNEEGYVSDLKEKPWLPLKVTIGILVLEKNVLSKLPNSLGTSFDIMGDLIPFLIKKGGKVKAFLYSGPWYDVGSMERYAKLNHDELGNFLK